MQHMDEGLLQAWLDGPRSGLTEDEREAVENHLAHCHPCSTRLQALVDSTADATELLAHLGRAGSEEMPAFGKVVARGRELHASRRRPRWQVATGWAASVVVALGAGWLASETRRPNPELMLPLERTKADAPTSARVGSGAGREETPGAEELMPVLASAGDTSPGDTTDPRAMLAARFEPNVLGVALGDSMARVAQSATPETERPLADTVERQRVADSVAVAVARARAPAPTADPGLTAGAPRRLAVSGRVIDSASGRPLESAQVFLPDLRMGTLTDREGRFRLVVDPLPDSARDLRVNAQLLGYGEERRELRIAGRDTVLSDFRMAAATVALEEVVVTGAPGSVRRPSLPFTARAAAEASAIGEERRSAGAGIPLMLPSPEEDSAGWRSASRAEAEALLGFPARSVPDLEVVSLEIGVLQETPILRVAQLLEDGTRLTLFQATRDLRSAETSGFASVRLDDGVFIAGRAALTADSIRALLVRVR